MAAEAKLLSCRWRDAVTDAAIRAQGPGNVNPSSLGLKLSVMLGARV